MRIKLILAICLIAICVVFIVVGGTIGGDSLREADNGNAKIYVGVSEPLTGFNSIGGEQELLGLEYARAVKPTVYVGGVAYDIEFVIKDDASEQNASVRAARELADAGVCAVLGSYGCSTTQAAGEIYDELGIPAIAMSCTTGKATSSYENYYSISFEETYQGGVLANFAYGKNLRSAAVITQAGDIYSKALGESFSAEFARLGGKTSSFSFSSAQGNFEDLITSISSGGYDCVFIPSSVTSAVTFIKQVRQAGLRLPIIGGNTWDTGLLISELGDDGQSVYFSSPYDAGDLSNINGSSFGGKFSLWVSRTSERLEKNGGVSYVTPASALAYDAYMLLCSAIEAADSFNPSAIALALKNASYSGVTSSIKLEISAADRSLPAYIKTIDTAEARFETIQTYLW